MPFRFDPSGSEKPPEGVCPVAVFASPSRRKGKSGWGVMESELKPERIARRRVRREFTEGEYEKTPARMAGVPHELLFSRMEKSES